MKKKHLNSEISGSKVQKKQLKNLIESTDANSKKILKKATKENNHSEKSAMSKRQINLIFHSDNQNYSKTHMTMQKTGIN